MLVVLYRKASTHDIGVAEGPALCFVMKAACRYPCHHHTSLIPQPDVALAQVLCVLLSWYRACTCRLSARLMPVPSKEKVKGMSLLLPTEPHLGLNPRLNKDQIDQRRTQSGAGRSAVNAPVNAPKHFPKPHNVSCTHSVVIGSFVPFEFSSASFGENIRSVHFTEWRKLKIIDNGP